MLPCLRMLLPEKVMGPTFFQMSISKLLLHAGWPLVMLSISNTVRNLGGMVLMQRSWKWLIYRLHSWVLDGMKKRTKTMEYASRSVTVKWEASPTLGHMLCLARIGVIMSSLGGTSTQSLITLNQFLRKWFHALTQHSWMTPTWCQNIHPQMRMETIINLKVRLVLRWLCQWMTSDNYCTSFYYYLFQVPFFLSIPCCYLSVSDSPSARTICFYNTIPNCITKYKCILQPSSITATLHSLMLERNSKPLIMWYGGKHDQWLIKIDLSSCDGERPS